MRLGGGVRSRLAVGLPVVAASASLVAALMAAAAARSTIEEVERLRVDDLRDRAGLALALDAARLRLAFRDRRTLDVREGFEDGRLIASSAWPEAIDTRVAPPEAPAGSDSFVWSVPTARGPRAAWVTREREGADGPTWVFGAWVDRTAAVADGAHESLASTRSLGARLSAGAAGGDRARIEVPVAVGEPPWSLVVDSDTTSHDRWVVVALIGAIAMASIAGIAAWWVVRGSTRSLDAALSAFEAVAEGSADYDFPASRDAALGEIVASYSRVRRALDLERERLRATARVAAWKETARRVAHEVKNPLAPIRITVENLVKARQRDPRRFDELFPSGTRAILEEVDRLSKMVTEFSEYARLPEPNRTEDDLDEIVDSVLALYDGDPSVSVRRERSAVLPSVAVDRDLIARAISNVIANAVREAASGGGPVEVATGSEPGCVVVSVRDHGPGFDRAALAHVFEPYVTGRAGGTGLGLAIAQRIVIEHGGTIEASNVRNGGARVAIRLPTDRRERE